MQTTEMLVASEKIETFVSGRGEEWSREDGFWIQAGRRGGNFEFDGKEKKHRGNPGSAMKPWISSACN
jgi:hypothetical protein